MRKRTITTSARPKRIVSRMGRKVRAWLQSRQVWEREKQIPRNLPTVTMDIILEPGMSNHTPLTVRLRLALWTHGRVESDSVTRFALPTEWSFPVLCTGVIHIS